MEKALRLLNNRYTKYIITGGFFLVWMGYFDRNDWFTRQQQKEELESTRDYISMLRADIRDMKAQRLGLENNPAILEKFAREQYRLKRDNEDLYIFE